MEAATTTATETPQPTVAGPAPATETAPALTGASLMESIIDARAREAEPPESQQPAPTPTPPQDQAPPAGETQDADYDDSMTDVEREFVQLLGDDRDTAYDLAVAVLNQCPQLIAHPENRAYLLSVLGLPTDAAAAHREIAEINRVEYEASASVAAEQMQVFDEFVAKGEALGLNKLEAAGLAALAYKEFEAQYWKGDGESRKTLDDWHGRVKSGNKLHAADGRAAYVKAFDAAFKKVAESHKNHRPRNTPEPPERPRYLGRPGDAGDLMLHILDQQGR